MLTRIGGSRIPWVTRSSSLTDSTVSFTTSRPKRHCDLPHEDDHSDGPPPRSRYVSTDPHLIRLRVSFPLPKDQQMREATVLDKANEIVSVSLFYDICTVNRVFTSLHSTFEG
ncbi:hypothetical protein PIB30_055979 [Stylosanthes scabra]|uniref:Uncharacterized protein n=1 Tax=Stylosanthes scabra TaxID=79078 RepID=A0ABU6UIR8_9FABA|nr:hypothetical protein [Stylosanthes scabra]